MPVKGQYLPMVVVPAELEELVQSARYSRRMAAGRGMKQAPREAIAALVRWKPEIRNAQIARLINLSPSRVQQLRKLIAKEAP